MYDSDDSTALQNSCQDLMKTMDPSPELEKRRLTREQQSILLTKRTETRLLFKDF